MVESLKHKELKKDAITKLKEKGFADEQIKTEQWVYFQWEGKERRYRVDVLADDGNKKVVYQVGNHSTIEIDLLKKFFETYYLDYADYGTYDEELSEDDELTLKEEKKELIKIYNNVEKLFENDDVYDFVKYDKETENTFKIGRKDAWMILPTSATISKDEFYRNITLTIGYVDKNICSIGIYAIQRPAVEIFLNINLADKEKYVEEIKKLPIGYYVYDGYRKMIKHHTNWEQYWNETTYDAHNFNMENLKEIEDRANLLLNLNGPEFPCLCLLNTEVKRDDLIKAFKQIKPIYRILKSMETFSKTIMEKIKLLPQWEWHIEQNEVEDLYEIYCDKFKKEVIKYQDFKKIARKLKKDTDYIKYVKE